MVQQWQAAIRMIARARQLTKKAITSLQALAPVGLAALTATTTFAAAGDIDLSLSASTGGKLFARLAGTGGYSNGTVLAVQSDGVATLYIVAGACNDGTNGLQACVAQYQSNGFGTSLSAANFGAAGVARVLSGWLDVQVRALVIDGARRIIVAGSCRSTTAPNYYQFCLTRLTGSGTIDTTYGTGGIVTTDFATTTWDQIEAATLQPDGKLVVAGGCHYGDPVTSQDGGICLARYLDNGSLDTTFDGDGKVLTNPNVGRLDTANAVHVLSDGKLLVSGTCNDGSAAKACIARYLDDGTSDSGFGTGGVVHLSVGGSTGSGDSTLQPDGKLLLSVGCTAGLCTLRMLADGSVDTEYGAGGLATIPMTGNRSARRVRLQPDGKAIIAGWCDKGVTNIDFCVARLHDSGQLDTSFGTGGQTSVSFASGSWQDYLHAIAITRDGKILLSGNCEDGAAAQYEACMVRLDGGSSAARTCNLDLNFDGNTDAHGDALILARVLLGMTGPAVLAGTPGVVSPSAQWIALRDRLFYRCGLPVSP